MRKGKHVFIRPSRGKGWRVQRITCTTYVIFSPGRATMLSLTPIRYS